MRHRLSKSLIAAVLLTLIAIYFAIAGETRAVEFAPVTVTEMKIGQYLERPFASDRTPGAFEPVYTYYWLLFGASETVN